MKIVLIFLALPWQVGAQTITENFADASHLDPSSTAVWNLTSHKLHVPLYVSRLSPTPYSEDDAMKLGDGSDGAFDSTHAASFDINKGSVANTYTLDTSKTYKFTTFTLDSGKTLKPNNGKPLLIEVQGDVVIAGTIDLRGVGGTGGAGGAIASNGLDGTSATGATGGQGLGGGGRNAGAGKNGGGAGYGAGGGSDAGGGAGGSTYGDPNFLTTLLEGSGGGGGGGGNTGAGGAGGAGAGILRVDSGGALWVKSTGSLLALGGNGSAGSGNGGGGGGGSGGSLELFAAGDFTFDGTLDVSGGAAGGTSNTGGFGGMRISCDLPGNNGANFNGNGAVNGGPLGDPNTGDLGITFYSKSKSYQILTKSYDTGESAPVYLSFQPTDKKTGSDTIGYELQGSNNNFSSDMTAFVGTNSLSALNGRRYFRVRITLQSGSQTASPSVTGFQMSTKETQFTYKVSGCGSVHAQNRPGDIALFATLASYLLMIPWMFRKLYNFRH